MKRKSFIISKKKMIVLWTMIWIFDIILRWSFPFYSYDGDVPQRGTNLAIVHWALFEGAYKQATCVYLASFVSRIICIVASVTPLNKYVLSSVVRLVLVFTVAIIDFAAMSINGYTLSNTTWAFWTDMVLLSAVSVISVMCIINHFFQKKEAIH